MPAIEKPNTEVCNSWRVFSNTEGAALEGELIDVSGIVAAMRAFAPDSIAFFSELGLPRIELAFIDVLTPETVIRAGLTIERELALPVYMAMMQLRKVEFLIEGRFLLPEGESYVDDHFESLRLPLNELARIWNIGTAACSG